MSFVPRTLTAVLLLVVGAQRMVHAQEVSVKLGIARGMKSAILNEDRKVLVHLPPGYDTSREAMSYRYETYREHPHVPFPCLYDGMRLVTAVRKP